MTKYLEIGQIVNTFGIKGMVKVKPFTDDNKRFDRLEKVYIKNKEKLKEIVISALKQASLYEEVKNRLKDSALGLSGGQQQRLCIARCIAMKPDVILMDEPTSALDPIATLKIENLIQELKKEYTIIIVTHNMQQATRISDYTAFFLMGEVIEYENTTELFTNPKNSKTEDYITGRFG